MNNKKKIPIKIEIGFRGYVMEDEELFEKLIKKYQILKLKDLSPLYRKLK